MKTRSIAFLLVCLGCSEGTTSNDDAGRIGQYDANVAPSSNGNGHGDAGVGPAHSVDAASSDGQVVVPPPTPCESTPGSDADKDGFVAGVDCNDCDSNVNPAAFDIAGNQVDDDCSGTADDEPTRCDAALSLASEDAIDAARALGLCRDQKGSGWGLVSAQWVFPNGKATTSPVEVLCEKGLLVPHPLGHGLVESFGIHNVPTQGKRMVVLSSGLAEPGERLLPLDLRPAEGQSPDAVRHCVRSTPPTGFPKITQGCSGNTGGNPSGVIFDPIALELKIKVPSNAQGLTFDSYFISSEFPWAVCKDWNDHFVTLLYSGHASVPSDHNISFDAKGGVISVNSAFVEVCSPVTLDGRTFPCRQGPTALEGTGLLMPGSGTNGQTYRSGGATGWLTTRSPVIAGETIIIRFAIWDDGDDAGDSNVLLDRFDWIVPKPTAPPPPKEPVTVPVI